MQSYRLVMIAIFAALTAIGAFIKIPFVPVPFTMQSFFVIMAGVVLGARPAMLSQLVYLIIGLSGFPVFSGGGGLHYITLPHFGYLLGFVAAAGLSGLAVDRLGLGIKSLVLSIAAGTLTIYLVGATYLGLHLHLIAQKPEAFSIALKSGMLIFLPGDLLKGAILLATALAIDLGAIRQKLRISPTGTGQS